MMDTVSVPTYPDVPNAAGVPSVARDVSAAVDDATLIASDAIILIDSFLTPNWGLFFPDGTPVFDYDTLLDEDFTRPYRISRHPVEKGQLQAYDKVALPYEASISMAIGDTPLGTLIGSVTSGLGSNVDRRTQFLFDLDFHSTTLELFTVTMPEFNWPNANIVGYTISRETRNGASLIRADVRVQQVKITTSTTQTTTNAQTPAGTDTVNTGVVQTAPLTPVQQSALPDIT